MTTKVNGSAYPGIWVEKQVTFVKLTFSKDISALGASDLFVLGTTTAAGAGTVADSSFGVVESALVQALKTLETKSTVLGISKYLQTTPTVVVTMAAGAGSTTTITVTSTTGLVAGQTVAVTAGTGSFLPGTKVTAVLSGTQFTVNLAPTVALSGATVTGSTFAGGQVDVMLGYAEGWFSDIAGVVATGLPVINAEAYVFAPGAAPTNVAGALVTVGDTAVTFGMEFVAFNGSMPVATFANGDLDLGPGATSGATPTNSPTGTPGYYPSELITA
jgi:hypothetical protein